MLIFNSNQTYSLLRQEGTRRSSLFTILCTTFCLGGSSLLYTAPTQALDVVSAVKYGLDYTTNTLRSEDNEIGEVVHKPGINLGLFHDTSSLELGANYSFERRIYEKDFWENESVTTGSGAARWHAIANRLDVFVRNVRRESTVRAVQAETQANRQVVSTTTAGSDLIFRPRVSDALIFGYTYIDRNTSGTQTDSTRNSGSMTYRFGMSNSSSLQLNTTYSEIEYSGLFSDANYTIATVGYVKTAGHLLLDIRIGHNWYDREGRGKTDDGTYQVVFTWQISSESTLALDAFHGIVDQSNNLTSTTGGDGNISENTGINAAFAETRGNLTYTHVFGRTTLSLSGNWSEQEYARDVPLDNERYGVRVNLSRKLTLNTNVVLGVNYSNRNFTSRGDDQQEFGANFQFNHKIGRAWNLNWGARYTDRDSEARNSYQETRVNLEIRYTFIGAN